MRDRIRKEVETDIKAVSTNLIEMIKDGNINEYKAMVETNKIMYHIHISQFMNLDVVRFDLLGEEMYDWFNKVLTLLNNQDTIKSFENNMANIIGVLEKVRVRDMFLDTVQLIVLLYNEGCVYSCYTLAMFLTTQYSVFREVTRNVNITG